MTRSNTHSPLRAQHRMVSFPNISEYHEFKGEDDLSPYEGVKLVPKIKPTEECQPRHVMHRSNVKFVHEYTQAKSQDGFTWLDLAFCPSAALVENRFPKS